MKNREELSLTLFRVRKSFFDIASSKGTFFLLETAVKTARENGLHVYNKDGKQLW